MPPNGSLKVAMVVPVGLGGYLHYSVGLCDALSRCGAQTTLVTSRDCDELPEHGNGFGVARLLGGMNRSQPRALRGLSYCLSLLHLRRFLKRERFDIGHFQDSFVPFADAPFLTLLGDGQPKTVFTAHDPDQDAITKAPTGRLNLRRLALGQIYKAVDGVVVLSRSAREEITDGFRVPPAKVSQIALGNYSTLHANGAPSKEEARRQLRIDSACKLVLFFGSIKPSKGLEHLIRAFARLQEAEPTAHLLIAGEPRQTDADGYRSLISELGIADSASFRPGYVPAALLPAYFAAADLVALPYLRIYQSDVLHLAYSFGRPVVATRVGGLAEEVDDGKSGLLVPPADEEALAVAMAEMLSDPSRLTAMGDCAKRLAETAYSWDAIARQTLDFYRSIL